MLFSSITFLFYFLPLVLLGYLLMPSVRAKNRFLLAASLLFYFWGEPWFVLVLLASATVNYFAGLMLERVQPERRAAVLRIAIELNLLLLVVFKYADFFADNLNRLVVPLGWYWPEPGLALPLGISFFTFQAISYLVDVYHRRVRAESNFLDFSLYLVMFPQLVAGPIVRFRQIARRLHRRRHDPGRASIGARIFVIGLAQKVLLANEIGRLADIAFAAQGPALFEAWLGLVAYSLQIYFDFCGYSNMAIGLGLIFGFAFPRNFRLPYRSASLTEFWRRWHISLSSWFRDYVYLPLGGNRRGSLRTGVNLAVVFIFCGLWHGASWNFVVWGAFHGTLLIAERAGFATVLRRLPRGVARGYLLLAVMLGWVLFRANDLGHALDYYAALAGSNGTGPMSTTMHLALHPVAALALCAGLVLALEGWRFGRAGELAASTVRLAREAIAGLSLLGLSLLAVANSSYNPFLYFRF